MFKFLFKGRGEPAKIETKRQSFERLVSELNAAIDEMAYKPKVTLDPETGHIAFDLPEQMPDEALALPAPEPEEAVEAAPAEPEAEAGTGDAEKGEDTPK